MRKIFTFLFVINLLIINGLFAQTYDIPKPKQEPEPEQKDEILNVPQQKADFPGGNKEYVKFLSNNLKYPNSALRSNIQGTVYVRFIVDKDGSIMKDCVKVAKSVDPALDAEAVRVIRMSPNWTPAQQNERPTRQRIRVPIKFKIADVENNIPKAIPITFEKTIEGNWTVETMPFPNTKKANNIFKLQKEAAYTLSNEASSLNITVTFKDGTSFSGVSLIEVGKDKNNGLLNITWKTGTNKKLLKKYGLTDFILAEKLAQIEGKSRIRLTIISVKVKNITIEKLKETDKIMAFNCVM